MNKFIAAKQLTFSFSRDGRRFSIMHEFRTYLHE